MRLLTHDGRRSLVSEVAPQSDQSSTHIFHPPKPSALALFQRQTIQHSVFLCNCISHGPLCDAAQNVKDEALYSLRGLQYAPWTPPEPLQRSAWYWWDHDQTSTYFSDGFQQYLHEKFHIPYGIFSPFWLLNLRFKDWTPVRYGISVRFPQSDCQEPALRLK